jgi:hypothetical protein
VSGAFPKARYPSNRRLQPWPRLAIARQLDGRCAAPSARKWRDGPNWRCCRSTVFFRVSRQNIARTRGGKREFVRPVGQVHQLVPMDPNRVRLWLWPWRRAAGAVLVGELAGEKRHAFIPDPGRRPGKQLPDLGAPVAAESSAAIHGHPHFSERTSRTGISASYCSEPSNKEQATLTEAARSATKTVSRLEFNVPVQQLTISAIYCWAGGLSRPPDRGTMA